MGGVVYLSSVLKVVICGRPNRHAHERPLEEPALRCLCKALAVAVREKGGPMRLAGLIPMLDPPRHDSAATIAALNAAGVEVKMITGDHQNIAIETARLVGLDSTTLCVDQSVLTGESEAVLKDPEAVLEAGANTATLDAMRLPRARDVLFHVEAMANTRCYTVLDYHVLYYGIMCYTMLYGTIRYCIIKYDTVPYNSIQYYIIPGYRML